MGKLGSFLKPFNFSFGKGDAVKTGRFLLFFILVYLLGSVFFEAFFPIRAEQQFLANNVLALLAGAGFPGSVEAGETAIISLEAGPSIEISELCTGRIELLIIVGAILASIGISWRKRLIGAAAAAAATTAFNYIRIFSTSLLILNSTDLSLIELTHNILFRAFLFLVIVVAYVVWFYWAVSSEVQKVQKKKFK